MNTKKMRTAGVAAAFMLAAAGVLVAAPAHAEESTSWYSGISCSSGRVVVTGSTSASGYIYHYQERSGTTHSKSWTNTTTSNRTWSKAFPSVTYASVVAQSTLNSGTLSCVA